MATAISATDPTTKPDTGMLDPELANEIRSVLAQSTQPSPISAVASHVLSKMSMAYGIRAPITQRIVDATLAMNQEYPPQVIQQIEDSDMIAVHMGIAATKMRTMSAWIKDILTNGNYRIWTIESSTEPTLPADLMQVISDRVAQEVLQFGLPPDQISQAQQNLIPIVQQHMKSLADDGAKQMEAHIDKRMQDMDFKRVMADFVDDFAVYPYAVMSGPFVRMVKRLAYTPNGIEEQDVPILQCSRVNPKDFYWSPDSTDCNNGEYVIEYASMTTNDLYMCRALPGFIQDSIDFILATDYNFTNVQYQQTHIETLQKSTYTLLGQSNRYPTIKYVGKLKAKFLIDHGLPVHDPLADVEVEVWVIGDRVVRLVQDPYPLGKRPYYLTSFSPMPGAMVGRGLFDMLRDVERVANSAIRNVVRNASYASGPIGEVDESRLQERDEDITTTEPYRVYRVLSDPMGGQGPAFRFQTIPMVVQELMNVYEMFSKEADRISGMNALLLGQVDQASNSRTASGLSMLIANASKVIKNTIGNIDRFITEPVITAMYNWTLLFDPTFKGKVDAMAVAHGANGALQREMSQAKTVEILQLITPYAQQGIVPPGTVIMLLRDILSSAGYDADTMLPPSNAAQMQMQNAITASQSSNQTGNNQQPAQGMASPQGQAPQGAVSASIPSVSASDGRFVTAPQ